MDLEITRLGDVLNMAYIYMYTITVYACSSDIKTDL